MPLAPFTEMALAGRWSRTDSLRPWKIAPLVRLNHLPQPLHLNTCQALNSRHATQPQAGQTGSPSVAAQRTAQGGAGLLIAQPGHARQGEGAGGDGEEGVRGHCCKRR